MMEESKYIRMLRSAILLCLVLVFSSFSLIEHYDVLPKTKLEQKNEKDAPSDESSFEVSPYDAIVPVFHCQFEQIADYFIASELIELDVLPVSIAGILERSTYQKILFRLIMAPNAP